MDAPPLGGLLERNRELGTLAAMLRSGGVALIEGDAGIGKTALLAATRAAAAEAGTTVLAARAGEREREFAWGVVRQLFDAPLRASSGPERALLLAGAAGLARPALGLETVGEEPSFSILHGLYWLTVNLAQRGPLLLAVDDLQWADRPSLRFLAHLAPRIAGLRLLLVGALQPIGSEPGASGEPRLVGALQPIGSEPGASGELLARLAAERATRTLRPRALSAAASAGLVRAGLPEPGPGRPAAEVVDLPPAARTAGADRGAPAMPSSADRGAPAMPSGADRGAPAMPSSADRGAPAMPSSADRGAPAKPSSADRGAPAMPSASDVLCAAAFAVSAGNPFFLRELIAELARAGEPPSVEQVRRLTPDAIARGVLPRLARLPPAPVALARALAILGTRGELRHAARLAGLDAAAAAAAAAELVRAGILSSGVPGRALPSAGDDAPAFVHPLVCSAIHRELPEPMRGHWHRQAAQLLAGEGASRGPLVPHLLAAPPNRDSWVVEQLRAAAHEARAEGAPEIAAACLRRALAEPPGDEALRTELRFALGQVELTQEPAAALGHLTEALRGARGERRATIALALGDALTLAGRPADAIPVLGGGIAELGDEASELRASLEAARLGAVRWEASGQPLRRKLVETLRRRAARGERLDPRLHVQLAIEATAGGTDRIAAVHHARLAVAAFDAPAGGTEAMLVLVLADQAHEARLATDAWLARARRRGWPLGAALGSTAAALAALYRGSVSEAVASARGAGGPGAELRLAPITVAVLVEALVERGELQLARAELAERGLAGALEPIWATTPLLIARGRLHAAAGDHLAAIDDLLVAGERADAWGVVNPAMTPWRSSAAVSLALAGRQDEAESLATEEVDRARRWGTGRAIGVALRAAGVVRGGEPGVALLRAAVTALEPAPAPLERARALTDLGATLRRAGQRGEAREHLRRGLDLAHHHGGLALAVRARDELLLAGARPRRNALRGRDALTPAELRVALLAADGQTNRQVAEALFITLRTVESQLKSAYAKLAVASPRELGEALGAR